MGMYTELFLQLQLSGDTPPEVIKTLNYMGGAEGCESISQPFKGSRWNIMLQCNSHYHFPLSVFQLKYLSYIDEYLLFVRCDFKNYEGEVENFLNWIAPWVLDTDDVYAGHYMYETSTEPTRVCFKGGKLVDFSYEV